MESTITLTFAQAILIASTASAVFGGLAAQVISLTFRNSRTSVESAITKQQMLDHIDECTREKQQFKEYVTGEFGKLREGIEGLYRRKGWLR